MKVLYLITLSALSSVEAFSPSAGVTDRPSFRLAAHQNSESTGSGVARFFGTVVAASILSFNVQDASAIPANQSPVSKFDSRLLLAASFHLDPGS
jgi:hypothetical protein